MAYLEPYDFETIIVNMFAGSPDIFLAISLIAIFGMSAYFRMSVVAMFFMAGMFVLLFSDTIIQAPIVAVFSIITGLVIGLIINRIYKK